MNTHIINKQNSAIKILNTKYDDIINRKNYISDLPYVSFLIPFYKQYNYLMACINSILNQTYPNIKILVVDDSDDIVLHEKLKNIFSKNKNIKLIKNEQNIGATKTMLKCIEFCETEYAVKIDQDDFYIDNDFLEKAMKKLLSDNSLSFVSFNTLTFIEQKNSFSYSPLKYYGKIDKLDYFKNMFKKYNKPTSSFPTVFKTIHLNPPSIGMLGDSNLYLNLLLYGNAYIFEDVIGVYRFNGNSLTNNLPEETIQIALNEKHNIYVKSKKLYKIDLYKTYTFQFFNTFKFYVTSNCNIINALHIANWANSEAEISFFSVFIRFFIYKLYKYVAIIYQNMKKI